MGSQLSHDLRVLVSVVDDHYTADKPTNAIAEPDELAMLQTLDRNISF